MKKIVDLFQEKKPVFSFELFPPKTDDGYKKLLETIQALAELKPDFISCTYGAGGGSREKTFDIVEHIQTQYGIIGVAHLTCVLNTKDQIKNILKNMQARKINNVLALRGDPPKEEPNWTPKEDNFKYSSELCSFIRQHYGAYFGIGVAGFPEGHVLCPNRDQDAQYLKTKIVSGAQCVITQLFFNNQDYFDYVNRLKKIGVNVPIIPGVLPITDFNSLEKFCKVCGTTITDEVRKIFEPIRDDKDATLKEGVRFAIRQCRELLAGKAPGIHFYCLNKVSPTDIILQALRQ